MINSILVKYSELAMRGKNRDKHELLLISTIQKALGREFHVKREQGRFLVERLPDTDFDDAAEIAEKICKIPGVHSVCPCVKTFERELDKISQLCIKYVNEFYADKPQTFKVNTKRADKTYALTSNEISAIIGEAIFETCENKSVQMIKPDFVMNVELRTSVYIYSAETLGWGGLPVPSSGNVMCLMSGGIDSPVAAFMMAKRGAGAEFVYFHSPPYVGEPVKRKVIDLSAVLSEYFGAVKLHIVRFTEVQEYLRENVPEDKLTIFMKRSMLSIAEMLALSLPKYRRMQALVVGDSVGQVASQTLHAINSIDSAVTTTILRPLAGVNKQETVDLAKKIGTFDISILPYEDCCTVFVPKHPETRPKRSVIEGIESSLDRLSELKTNALSSIETIEF